MINIYIKELENKEEIEILQKIPKWASNLLWKIIKSANWIVVKKIEEKKKIYLIPNIESKKAYEKIRKKLEKEKTQTQKLQLILSKKEKIYQEYLKGFKIVEGKDIFFSSLEKILQKILQENLLVLQDVYVLANHYQEQNIKQIRKLAPKVKSMNIITKEIAKYRTLEEIIQEQGIAICVANNKRKSLKKAKLIINLDFSEEELNQYSLFRNSLIINGTQEKISNLKGFEGIIVQDIEIKLNQEEKEWIKKNNLEKAYRQLDIYESLLDGNKTKKEIQITKLKGNNGEINEKELRNWQKILTNTKN